MKISIAKLIGWLAGICISVSILALAFGALVWAVKAMVRMVF